MAHPVSPSAQAVVVGATGEVGAADGHVDLATTQRGIDAVAGELGLASVAADEIYQR